MPLFSKNLALDYRLKRRCVNSKTLLSDVHIGDASDTTWTFFKDRLFTPPQQNCPDEVFQWSLFSIASRMVVTSIVVSAS
jgi:hypothetical protein